MKHKTLFRLLVKAIGVWMLASGAATMVGYLAFLVQALAAQNTTGYNNFSAWGYSLIGPTAQILIGLYLFLGAKWIVDRAIPSNRPYCHECGYDLTGASGNVCNECGTPFRAEAPQNSPVDE